MAGIFRKLSSWSGLTTSIRPGSEGTLTIRTPTGGGGGGGGGGGVGGNTVLPKVTVERVETAVSAEVTVAIANGAVQVNWNKFPGADGYRIFLYQKTGDEVSNSKYIDVMGSSAQALTLQHPEGLIAGEPTYQNNFRVIAVAECQDTTQITKIGSYAKDLLKTIGGKTDADLDLDSFADVDTQCPEIFKAYISDQTTIGGLMGEIEQNIYGSCRANETGKIGLYLTDPYNTPVATFNDIDFIASPAVSTERANTYNKIIVAYNENPINGEMQEVVIDVSEATRKWVTNETLEVMCLWVTQAGARRLGQIIAANLKRQQPLLSLSLRSNGFAVNCGDTILLNRVRGFTTSGAYVGDRWVATNYNRNLEVAIVDIEAAQPFPDVERVRKWAGDTVPAWGSATQQQRETYGFIHDANSLVDTVYRQGVYWLR